MIVGANLTGGAAATTLRAEGFEGRILLIGEEAHAPYERPPLSKEYLRGEQSFEKTFVQQPSWYQENDVELLLGRTAVRLDLARRDVELRGGDRVRYDRLLLATGGRNRRLSVSGNDLLGVLELRTKEDADEIRTRTETGGRVVVVGAGFIGAEVAASLRSLGTDVDVLEIDRAPLVRALGQVVGRVFEGIHRDRGIRFHFGESVERFEGGSKVEAVRTTGGSRLECDFVVVGAGILPNTRLAEGSGLAIDDGIVVDEFCRTPVDGVFAAGDVANHLHPIFARRIRVEHWDNALKQGAAAARSMMGRMERFDDPHWFWSDQYEHNLQSVGYAGDSDELVIRGSLEARDFLAFYLKAGVVRAVAGLNRGKDVRRSAGLIRSRRPVDRESLRDEDVDLRRLASNLSEEAEEA